MHPKMFHQVVGDVLQTRELVGAPSRKARHISQKGGLVGILTPSIFFLN